jgi:hypothetical protein
MLATIAGVLALARAPSAPPAPMRERQIVFGLGVALPLRDLERLIREDGEVCTAVERKVAATS